jgi:hypothetical protein
MTRIYHTLAALLFALALFLALDDGPPGGLPDPNKQIIMGFKRAGFSLLTIRRTALGQDFVFERPDCAVPANVLLLETVHRDATQAIAAIPHDDAEPIFVYGGSIVTGLGWADIGRLWLGRKLRVALGLAASSPWDSTALAVFVPRSCPAAAVDWKSFDAPF